jgi:hypothetical protein
MNIIDSIDTLKTKAGETGNADVFSFLVDELQESLHIFWEKAGKILHGSGVKLLDPPAGFYALENNFFSALFLYSYYRAGIKSERRILYSAINQCLRGMVTGCDNILDDEYKRTLETSLPQNGTKFRSVLDIMVSDRVLFELSLDAFNERENILTSSAISLRSLVESGYQEATEEGGITEILPPDRVLETVHHYKTGILFNCPWAIPSRIENTDEEKKRRLKSALYNIGIGCQIMDDMADLERDIQTKHHNYVVSLIYHDPRREKWEYLKSSVISAEKHGAPSDILMNLSDVKEKTVETARSYLTAGLNALFEENQGFLVEPAIKFLSMRIGVDKYF